VDETAALTRGQVDEILILIVMIVAGVVTMTAKSYSGLIVF
jgi:hypothetical protein